MQLCKRYVQPRNNPIESNCKISKIEKKVKKKCTQAHINEIKTVSFMSETLRDIIEKTQNILLEVEVNIFYTVT